MRILLLSDIAPSTVERLNRKHEVVDARGVSESEVGELITDCEAIVFRSGVTVTAALMRRASNLRLVIRAGSGIDNIDVDYVKNRGITLVRVPRPGAYAVAELAFAMMLALSRNLLIADAATRKGVWLKHKLENYVLRGKTLGVVGVGNIGCQVAKMGSAWGMHVIGCVEHLTESRAREYRLLGIELVSLDRVATESDYISIHVPLKDSTRGLIDQFFLSKTKPGAYLINLARGGVVDEDALYQQLVRPDGLRGAGLDVHQSEGPGKVSALAEHPNVILTPHMGATTVDTQREIGEEIESIIENQSRLLEETAPLPREDS